MISENPLLGIILAIIAYACLYLGKGVQKFAIVGYTKDGVTKGEKGKNMGIWIGGLILTGSFMFIHWIALNFAEIALIAPIEGLGLIILCVFSYFILKEPIDRMKGIGISLILIGLILTSLFVIAEPETPMVIPFNVVFFIISLCVIMGVFIILGLLSKFNNYKAAGLIFGSFAGGLMCFQTITKRISWIDGFEYFAFIMFGFAAATLLMTNFGFLKADAVVVVPSFTAVSITLPTLLAVFTFEESIEVLQWIGIAITVIGVIFLTAFSPTEAKKENMELDSD